MTQVIVCKSCSNPRAVFHRGLCNACWDRHRSQGTLDQFPGKTLLRSDDGIIDEVAIDRAIHGHPIALTTKERVAAVRLMAAKGRTQTEITRVLRVAATRVAQILESQQAAA